MKTLLPDFPPVETASPSDALFSDRKRWTVDECARLERQGRLPDRYEVIDGEILVKNGHGVRHSFAIMNTLTEFWRLVEHERTILHLCHIPSRADRQYNLPEVDVAAYRTSARDIKPPLPYLRDLLLAVEVSDQTLYSSGSTLALDLTLKADLYARSCVPEYWVLDVINRCLVVHRTPCKGKYGRITSHGEDARVTPAFTPSQPISVCDLL